MTATLVLLATRQVECWCSGVFGSENEIPGTCGKPKTQEHGMKKAGTGVTTAPGFKEGGRPMNAYRYKHIWLMAG